MPSPTPPIRIANLSKVYHLYERHNDRLKEALHPFRKKYHQDFHALNNITLEISANEALGIVGCNGSGKSTLLKIITGVLTPTAGDVLVQGRISALLELGTGFNPELTGLENIYFNGTIQGREREETERIIPDILAFADIGPYIHQAVKTYSSGMFARLAFAVAVNVDPEILIVDEALSVGDMRFQQKCIRKMQGFRDQGKTILFVSHDPGSIIAFCDRVLWLDHGRIREIGGSRDVCRRYAAFMAYGEAEPSTRDTSPVPPSLTAMSGPSDRSIPWVELSELDGFGDGGARITHAALLDAESSSPAGIVRPDQNLRLVMRVTTAQAIHGIGFGLLVKNRLGQSIFGLNNWYLEQDPVTIAPHKTIDVAFTLRFPSLTRGRYSFSLAVGEGTLVQHVQHHWIHDALCVDVCGGDPASRSDCMMALPKHAWTMQWDPANP